MCAMRAWGRRALQGDVRGHAASWRIQFLDRPQLPAISPAHVQPAAAPSKRPQAPARFTSRSGRSPSRPRSCSGRRSQVRARIRRDSRRREWRNEWQRGSSPLRVQPLALQPGPLAVLAAHGMHCAMAQRGPPRRAAALAARRSAAAAAAAHGASFAPLPCSRSQQPHGAHAVGGPGRQGRQGR